MEFPIDTLINEFWRTSALPAWILALRLIGAIVLCAVIGFEREMQNNSAGLRTNILVGLAATTFALITLQLISNAGDAESVQFDPIRLVEAVTAGVAFLAAGTIIVQHGDVRGLTTGAGMWLSASIGLAVGLGFWSLAVFTTIAGVLVLAGLRKMEVSTGLKEVD